MLVFWNCNISNWEITIILIISIPGISEYLLLIPWYNLCFEGSTVYTPASKCSSSFK